MVGWLALRPERLALQNADHSAFEADVLPFRRQQFALPHAGVERQRHRRQKPRRSDLLLGLLQQSLNLTAA